jgi:hypothetical protein
MIAATIKTSLQFKSQVTSEVPGASAGFVGDRSSCYLKSIDLGLINDLETLARASENLTMSRAVLVPENIGLGNPAVRIQF